MHMEFLYNFIHEENAACVLHTIFKHLHLTMCELPINPFTRGEKGPERVFLLSYPESTCHSGCLFRETESSSHLAVLVTHQMFSVAVTKPRAHFHSLILLMDTCLSFLYNINKNGGGWERFLPLLMYFPFPGKLLKR